MIYLECDSDKAFVRALGILKKEIVCADGKGNVCNNLEKNMYSVGLVDEDPLSAKPNYMDKLRIQLNENNIKLFFDEKNKNFLIVLYPRLEEWILEVAKNAGIDPTKYSLPDNVKQFRRQLNVRLDKKFGEFVQDLKDKSQVVRKLEEFLRGKFEMKGGKDELD
jgi:hypothetical protein